MAAGEGEAGNRNLGQVYRCFLVRCRLEEGAGPNHEPGWRFTLHQVSPETDRHSFTSLHDLAAHLEAALASASRYAAGPKEATRTAKQSAATKTE